MVENRSANRVFVGRAEKYYEKGDVGYKRKWHEKKEKEINWETKSQSVPNDLNFSAINTILRMKCNFAANWIHSYFPSSLISWFFFILAFFWQIYSHKKRKKRKTVSEERTRRSNWKEMFSISNILLKGILLTRVRTPNFWNILLFLPIWTF